MPFFRATESRRQFVDLLNFYGNEKKRVAMSFFKFDMEREKRTSQGWKSISLWKAKQAENTFDRAGKIVSRKSNSCLFTFSRLSLSWCFIKPSEWVNDWVSVNVFQRTSKGETESICCSQAHTYCAAVEYQRVHLVLCCAMENLWWKISVNNSENYALVFHRKNNHLTTMRTACEAIEVRGETEDRRFLWKFLESGKLRERIFLQRNLLIRLSERIDEKWTCGEMMVCLFSTSFTRKLLLD